MGIGDHNVNMGTPGAPDGSQFRILELALDIGSGEVLDNPEIMNFRYQHPVHFRCVTGLFDGQNEINACRQS